MNKEIIISRYYENITWLDNIICEKKSIYDKSNEVNNYIKLQNKGRESDTYLRHIINNYNNLSDLNIFVQGHPFDHCPNLFDLINNDKYTQLGSNIYCDKYGNPHHNGLSLIEIWGKISIKTIPEEINFTPGAMFIVEKKQILQHDICFYEKLLHLHNEYEQMPWIIERFWSYIWENKI
jgi:hypothetical protein